MLIRCSEAAFTTVTVTQFNNDGIDVSSAHTGDYVGQQNGEGIPIQERGKSLTDVPTVVPYNRSYALCIQQSLENYQWWWISIGPAGQ